MTTFRELRNVTLSQNARGTFYAEVGTEGDPLKAYLPNGVDRKSQIHSSIESGKSYWASIRYSQKAAFIDGLIETGLIELYEHDEVPYFEICGVFATYDGTEQLSLHLTDGKTIQLRGTILDSVRYKIFHNSFVQVKIKHEPYGFSISEWYTILPSIDGECTGRLRVLKNDDPQLEKLIGEFRVNYKYRDTSLEATLPVTLWQSYLDRLGIADFDGEIGLPSRLAFDHEERRPYITSNLSYDELLEWFNTPTAELIFLNREGDVYRFKTNLVNGLSLLVTCWPSVAELFTDSNGTIQEGAKIHAFVTHKYSNGWNNFYANGTRQNYYDCEFRCLLMKETQGESFALIETIDSSRERLLLSRHELMKRGLYGINSHTIFRLEAEKGEYNHWAIKNISYEDMIHNVELGKIYSANIKVVRSWKRYEKRPFYGVKLTRSADVYAFHNHCIATIELGKAVFLVVVPASLLLVSGIQRLEPDGTLNVELSRIWFPVFEKTPAFFLCVERILSYEDPTNGEDCSTFREIRIRKSLESEGEGNGYDCCIVDQDEWFIFYDKLDQLGSIDQIEKYIFHVRLRLFKGRTYVNELISAKTL